jgi:osmotically-inducible protein OsmY
MTTSKDSVTYRTSCSTPLRPAPTRSTGQALVPLSNAGERCGVGGITTAVPGSFCSSGTTAAESGSKDDAKTRKPDADLKNDVIDELRWRPSVNSTRIGMAVDDGAVMLSWEVDSYPELRLEGYAGKRVHEVTTLAQELTVHAGAMAVDVEAAIGAAIVPNAQLEGKHITVTAGTDGLVTLDGTVRSWSASGVTAVTNNLGVER